MAVVNRKFNYLFLAEPHTASRSLREALLQHPQSEEVGSHHATLKELEQRGVRRLRRCYMFSVVRNPADVLVTKWLHSKPEITLGQYIGSLAIQTPDLKNLLFRHTQDSRHLLHYENLQTELDTLLGGLGIPFVELPTIGQTPDKRPWPEYYGYNELDTVIRHFPEATAFGYADELRGIRQILLDKG